MKKYIAASVLTLGALMTASSCVSMTDGDSLDSIAEMSELEFSRMSQYIYLGTKIGTERLIESGGLSAETAGLLADAVEAVVGQPILDFTGGFLTDVVAESVDLSGDEIMLLLLIVEQEILARGGATFLDGDTGLINLTERTEDLLLLVADAIRSAANL